MSVGGPVGSTVIRVGRRLFVAPMVVVPGIVVASGRLVMRGVLGSMVSDGITSGLDRWIGRRLAAGSQDQDQQEGGNGSHGWSSRTIWCPGPSGPDCTMLTIVESAYFGFVFGLSTESITR